MHAFNNPIAPKGADPWLVKGDGGYYYCLSADGGVCVARVEHIAKLAEAQPVKVWQPPEGTMYSRELWAPELHYLDGDWYIYVAADDGRNENHRMYALKCSSQNPLDPFSFAGKVSDSTDKWAIDGTVMRHGGRLYFIWSGWEGDINEAQHLYIAQMGSPLEISSERVRISSPELDWELKGSGGGLPTINEGAAAIEHNGVTHVAYSAAGSWCDDYCIGLLTLRQGGDPLSADSWVKSGKPILSKREGMFGPGHCSFTSSPDGSRDYIIYHANLMAGTGWGGRSVWAKELNWDEANYPVIIS